jgi:hypothetical protein
MRGVVIAIAVVSCLLAVLAAPMPALACRDCTAEFRWFLQDYDQIVLAEYRGRSGSRIEFDVIDVFKGPEVRTLRLEPMQGMPGPHPRGRWIIYQTKSLVSNGFRVSADGTVMLLFDGAGRPGGYPRTLAGWYRALGLRMPDTSSVAPGVTPTPPSPGSAMPILFLVCATFGAVAALRRLEKAGRVARTRSDEIAARTIGHLV